MSRGGLREWCAALYLILLIRTLHEITGELRDGSSAFRHDCTRLTNTIRSFPDAASAAGRSPLQICFKGTTLFCNMCLHDFPPGAKFV